MVSEGMPMFDMRMRPVFPQVVQHNSSQKQEPEPYEHTFFISEDGFSLEYEKFQLQDLTQLKSLDYLQAGDSARGIESLLLYPHDCASELEAPETMKDNSRAVRQWLPAGAHGESAAASHAAAARLSPDTCTPSPFPSFGSSLDKSVLHPQALEDGCTRASEPSSEVDFLYWFAETERKHGPKYILLEVKNAVEQNLDDAAQLDKTHHFVDLVKYVLEEEAQEMEAFHHTTRVPYTRDKDHGGMRLKDFHEKSPAKVARLSLSEVAALRVYTTALFRLVNEPLRRLHARNSINDPEKLIQMGHPLRFTTFLIYRAVKKLRACNLFDNDMRSHVTRYLWRGIADRNVPDEFMRTGGADVACMSTSKSLKTVLRFSKNQNPLVFRLAIESPMEYGASIQWLSTVPQEDEVLYPPLTFLKPVARQKIKGSEGYVITVKPSFPS